MKIVHLIDYFQPKVGYQEYFLAKEHQKSKHDVTVVTSDYFFPFPDYQNTYKKILGERNINPGTGNEEGIKVLRLPSFEVVPGSLVVLRGLKKELLRIKPDLVICHNVFSITSYLAAISKKDAGFRLIYDTHAAPFNTDFWNNPVKKIYYLIFRDFAVPVIKKEADAIFAIGEEERKFISGYFKIQQSSLPLIPLGVDTERFKRSQNGRKKLRNSFSIKDDKVVIVFAGKITVNKDVHILIRSLKNLNNPNTVLLLVGGGNQSYIDSLKKEGAGLRIIWIPFVRNTELSEYYSASDIGIWPGDPSITMLEAMACGAPIIIPDWNQTEYLDKSGAVIRFKRGDSDDLKNKIENTINNPVKLKKMSLNSVNYIKKHQSWPIIAKKVLNLVKI